MCTEKSRKKFPGYLYHLCNSLRQWNNFKWEPPFNLLNQPYFLDNEVFFFIFVPMEADKPTLEKALDTQGLTSSNDKHALIHVQLYI